VAGLLPTREAWWYLGVIGLALLITSMPVILAYAQRSYGLGFVGMLWTPPDAAQYFAAMREGAASSSWLIHDHLTTEAHQPVLMYVTYVALGKLAWVLDSGQRLTYHLTELGARAALVLAVLLLARAALPTALQRRIALVLVLFGSGPFLFVAMLDTVSGASYGLNPADIWQPEFSSVVLLHTAPHMMLGVACSLLAVRAYLLAWSGHARLGGVLGTLAACAVGLTNAFSVVLLGAAVAAHLGVMWIRHRRFPVGPFLAATAMLLAAGCFLIYNALMFRRDPFWSQTYGAIAGMVSPGPIEVLLLIGGTAVLAVPGLAILLRTGTPAQWMVLAWIVSGAVLMYIPTGVERRFALGLQPVLAVAAAPAVAAAWDLLRAGRLPARAILRPLILTLFVFSCFGSTLPIKSVIFGTALGQTAGTMPTGSTSSESLRPFTSPWVSAFYPVQLDDAAAWLARETGPDDNLLADPWTSNMLASHVDGRFYVGHGVATPSFGDKAVRVLEAYQSSSPDALVALMREQRLRYVVYGPYQRAIGIQHPSSASLNLVYSRNDVEIFEVVPEVPEFEARAQ
jgi:hypothetical protein